MENRKYDPRTESLKDFWNSQQERLALLSGMPITDDILRLTAAFGESEIAMFEKLMQTQSRLAALLAQTNASEAGTPVLEAPSLPAPKTVSNPVIERLDLSDPKTVRRCEIDRKSTRLNSSH